MIVLRKATVLLTILLFSLNVFSQTFTFSNTTTATINSTATTTRSVTVTGVATTGMVLEQC